MAVQVLCAWCNATIREGDKTKASSHGICVQCTQCIGLLPTKDIRGLSREQRDALPMGVIDFDRTAIAPR